MCPSQELQQLVRRTRQEARARQQTQEHEAERLRIEVVTLRDALEEETASRASLEGQLRMQREETGEGGGCLTSPSGPPGPGVGSRRGAHAEP